MKWKKKKQKERKKDKKRKAKYSWYHNKSFATGNPFFTSLPFFLLDGDGLGQIPGEIDVQVTGNGEPVGNELQGDDVEKPLQAVNGVGELDLDTLLLGEFLVSLIADDNWLAGTCDNWFPS